MPPQPLPPMINRSSLFWLAFGLVLFFAVRALSEVLLPFLLGIAIAYFLNPTCEALSRRRIPRSLSAFLVLFTFVILLAIVLLLVVPVLSEQVTQFAAAVPDYAQRFSKWSEVKLNHFIAMLPPSQYQKLRALAGDSTGMFAEQLVKFAGSIWQGGAALVSFVSMVIITPVVAFYMLRDWQILVAKVDSWLPRNNYTVIREQLSEIDRTIAGFVRGQALVCVILGTCYAGFLTLIGVNFGAVIGLVAGLLSFIPFVGTGFGFIAASLVALVQFDTYTPLIQVMALFSIANIIEGNVLAPKLVGESVGLHPVWIIFALLAGHNLFGFVGLLLAVPVAAVLGVLIRFTLSRYRQSSYYLGQVRPRQVKPL